MTDGLHRVVAGYLDTNCWIVRSNGRALIVDPGDDPDRILAALDGLTVTGIVLTHAHADHVLALPSLAAALPAPVIAHPAEREVWAAELDHLDTHGYLDAGTATATLVAQGNPPLPRGPLWDGRIDHPVADGDTLDLGDLPVTVLHTPGHSPGSITLHLPGHLLTGDTLFPGGPGLTGAQWPLTSFPAIMRSVRRLLDYPADTVIHPGHGADTTVGAERPHLGEWEARGW